MTPEPPDSPFTQRTPPRVPWWLYAILAVIVVGWAARVIPSLLRSNQRYAVEDAIDRAELTLEQASGRPDVSREKVTALRAAMEQCKWVQASEPPRPACDELVRLTGEVAIDLDAGERPGPGRAP